MKTPNEKDAVAFLTYLREEAEPTMDCMKQRTPFDAVHGGVQNAYDTLGRHEGLLMPSEWCELALSSIRLNCCEEPEDVRLWFKARGLRY